MNFQKFAATTFTKILWRILPSLSPSRAPHALSFSHLWKNWKKKNSEIITEKNCEKKYRKKISQKFSVFSAIFIQKFFWIFIHNFPTNFSKFSSIIFSKLFWKTFFKWVIFSKSLRTTGFAECGRRQLGFLRVCRRRAAPASIFVAQLTSSFICFDIIP